MLYDEQLVNLGFIEKLHAYLDFTLPNVITIVRHRRYLVSHIGVVIWLLWVRSWGVTAFVWVWQLVTFSDTANFYYRLAFIRNIETTVF